MPAPAAAVVPLLVVRLTDSFSEFWPLLAGELDVPLIEREPTLPEPLPTAIALVLAAGGAELEVESVLQRLVPTLPRSLPVFVVGASKIGRASCRERV